MTPEYEASCKMAKERNDAEKRAERWLQCRGFITLPKSRHELCALLALYVADDAPIPPIDDTVRKTQEMFEIVARASPEQICRAVENLGHRGVSQ